MARSDPRPKTKLFKDRRSRTGRISERHLTVINEYFRNGFHKRDAMRKAGYSETICVDNTDSVFARPDVREEIEKRMTKAAEKADVTVEWVVERLKRVAAGPETLAKFIKVQEDGSLMYDFAGATEEELAVIGSLQSDFYTAPGDEPGDRVKVKKFKIDTLDAMGALNSLGKHLGMFKEKVEIEAGDTLADLLARGRARIREEGAE